MPRILLQAGHWPSEPGGGGAPGEAQWNKDCAEKVAAILREQGVDVAVIGTFINLVTLEEFPPSEIGQDYDSAWFLHYDGSTVDGDSGYCAARWQFESRAGQADALVALWKDRYGSRTGLPWREERIGNAMRQYYAHKYLSWQTPGIILEHGFGDKGDKELLHDHIDFIAGIDAAVILESLGLPYSYPEDPRHEPVLEPPLFGLALTPVEVDAFSALKDLGWVTREILEEKINYIGVLESQVPTGQQQAILDTMAGLNANADSINNWVSEIGALQAVVIERDAEITALKATPQAAKITVGETTTVVSIAPRSPAKPRNGGAASKRAGRSRRDG